MKVEQLITNFFKENNITKKIQTTNFKPIQIFYQIEPVTNEFIEKAEDFIKNNRTSKNTKIKKEEKIEEKSTLNDIDSDDFCTIDAKKALEILDNIDDEEDDKDMYSEDEIVSSNDETMSSY